MELMIAAVRAHAVEKYTEGGWDYVVECWTDADITEEIFDCRSVAEAIDVVGQTVQVLDDHRREVRSLAW